MLEGLLRCWWMGMGLPPLAGQLDGSFALCRGCGVSPASDPTKAYGWANQTTMRAHIDAHLSGSLAGEVPSTWLQQHGRTRCLVCGLSVSDRHGVHPTCRPEARAAAVGPHPPDAGGRGCFANACNHPSRADADLAACAGPCPAYLAASFDPGFGHGCPPQ